MILGKNNKEFKLYAKLPNGEVKEIEPKPISITEKMDEVGENKGRRGIFDSSIKFTADIDVDNNKMQELLESIESTETSFYEAEFNLDIYNNEFKEEDIYAFKSFLFLDLRALLKIGYATKEINTTDGGTYIKTIKYDERNVEEYKKHLIELQKLIES